MKASLFAAAVSIALFAGCMGGSPEAAAQRENARVVRVMLDARSTSGGLADDMYTRNVASLEGLKMQGVPEETVRELERLIRKDIEETIDQAVVPVFTKTFTGPEITQIAGFLASPAGKEFIKQGWTKTSITVILANSATNLRAEIREFVQSPAGRKYIETGATLFNQAQQAVNDLWFRNADRRNREIQQIVDRMQR